MYGWLLGIFLEAGFRKFVRAKSFERLERLIVAVNESLSRRGFARCLDGLKKCERHFQLIGMKLQALVFEQQLPQGFFAVWC